MAGGWTYTTAIATIGAYALSRTYSNASYLLIPLSWILYSIYLIYIYPFYVSPFRHLPEPKGAQLPWSHAQATIDTHNGAPFRQWINTVPNNGMFRVRIFLNQERLFITSPEAIKEVTVTRPYDFQKPPAAGFMFRELLGNGVLVAEGAEHQRQRKALMPAFAFRHVKNLYPLFWQKARQSAEEIAKASRAAGPNSTQKVYEWASRTTLDIIGLAGLGKDFNSVGEPDGKVVSIYRSLFDNEPPQFRWTILGIVAPVQLLWRLPLPVFDEAKKAAADIRAYAFDVVKEKRAMLEKDEASMIDIASVAMKSGQFTDDDVVDQMMTFLAAGHETTASALTWAMYALCQHPEMQERLREEVRASLPSISDPESTITAGDIDKLPYLNAITNETLRIIPSVPTTIREALVDGYVQSQFVPAGTRILLSPWGQNASLSLWGENALDFNPERWLLPNQTNSGGAANNFASLTFLHGPRSCIGKDFAKSEFMCLLAGWVGRFRVRWKDGVELPMDVEGTVTLKPRHRLPIVFEEVGGW